MCQKKRNGMYEGVKNIFKRYWIAYGGFRALIYSPYLHFAIVLLVITWHEWWNKEWWLVVITVIPNLLGFTLGGFAIFIGFGDEKFRSLLAQPDENGDDRPTIYVKLCSTFVHFIIVQMFALFYALIVQASQYYIQWLEPYKAIIICLNKLSSFIGYLLFLYALTSMLAATMHVFRIASMFSMYQKYQQKKDAQDKK